MEIKHKSFDLFTERYPRMLKESHRKEFYVGYIVYLTNTFYLTILPVIYREKELSKIQAKTSWGCKKYFPNSYEGFKLACEWFDNRRIRLAEKIL